MFYFFQGNQENRIVIYDNKIIDYINFIMRAGDFEDCTIDKVIISQFYIYSTIYWVAYLA